MIDCENEVFSRVAKAVRDVRDDVNLTSDYIPETATFPHVSIMQIDSVTAQNQQSHEESLVTVTFQVDVYSNKHTGRKSEAKEIMAVISDAFFKMNFLRLEMMPLPSLYDSTIYRITARFRADTDGKWFYRRRG